MVYIMEFKNKYFGFLFFVFVGLFVTDVYAQKLNSSNKIGGSNTQIVTVTGSVLNKAESGSTARTNIGSVVGAGTGGSNHQVISIGGSVSNTATGGSTSEINIGSTVNGQRYDNSGMKTR